MIAPVLITLVTLATSCDRAPSNGRVNATGSGATVVQTANLPSTKPTGQAAGRPAGPSASAAGKSDAAHEVSATAAEPREVRPARERVIDFYTIGGGSTNQATRYVGYVNSKGGWSAFVDRHARRSVDYGVRRIWLHCPFGNGESAAFDLDQFVLAQEAGLRYLTDDFVEVWKPVVDGTHFGVPIEVVAYLGSVDDRDGRAGPNTLQRMRAEGRGDLWLDRAVRSVLPPMRAGMSIGFDTTTDEPDHPPDNFMFSLASLVRSLGTRVYVEPRPRREYPGWHDFNVLTIERFWRRSNPTLHKDAAWAVEDHEITGEVIRLVFVPRGTEGNRERIDALAEQVREILREGHSVLMSLKVFREGGWPLERLVAGLDGPVTADTRNDGAKSP